MNPKQRAAEAALPFVQSGMIIGLGTGSTAEYFLQGLAAALKDGTLKDIRGVATSRQSERRARKLGIPLVSLGQSPRPDVTIDGADEIDPRLNLIKGGGGALVREKIVAQNSRKLIIIADASKKVANLGVSFPLPVEVLPFCHDLHEPFFRSIGAADFHLRQDSDGSVFVTDNGNYVYDLRFKGTIDPFAIEDALAHRAGVVDCGLFLNIASVALVADNDTVERLERPVRPPE